MYVQEFTEKCDSKGQLKKLGLIYPLSRGRGEGEQHLQENMTFWKDKMSPQESRREM